MKFMVTVITATRSQIAEDGMLVSRTTRSAMLNRVVDCVQPDLVGSKNQ